jgi:hypothetical protein
MWIQISNIGTLSSGYLSTWIFGVLNSDAQVSSSSSYSLGLSMPQQQTVSMVNTLQLALIGSVSGEWTGLES